MPYMNSVRWVAGLTVINVREGRLAIYPHTNFTLFKTIYTNPNYFVLEQEIKRMKSSFVVCVLVHMHYQNYDDYMIKNVH